MATSNSFFGMRTGSTKNFTFAIQDGKQVTKEKAASVTNPNTTAQQATRSCWAYASKFYGKAEQNLFRFAYEDQQDGENDFNAFMRHNVERSPYASRKMLDDIKTPWFAPWAMSYGSLRSIDDNIEHQDNGDVRMFIASYGIAANQITLGQLSESLMEDYSVKEGDIVTFGCIKSSATTSTVESIEDALRWGALTFDNDTAPAWIIDQFVVSTDPGAYQIKMTDLTRLVGVTISNGEYLGYHTPGTTPRAAFMILSRKTAGGLKVSTNNLILDSQSQYAYGVGMSNTWREYCDGESTGTGTFGPAKATSVLEGGDSSYQNEYNNGYKYKNMLTKNPTWAAPGEPATDFSMQFELDHIDKASIIAESLRVTMTKNIGSESFPIRENFGFKQFHEVTGKPYRYVAYLRYTIDGELKNIAELRIMGERVDAFEVVFADQLDTLYVRFFEWWDQRPERKKPW